MMAMMLLVTLLCPEPCAQLMQQVWMLAPGHMQLMFPLK